MFLLDTLRSLLLSNNQISEVLQSRMELLANLEVLDMSTNDITVLPSFDNMANLKELYCSKNHITHFEATHFADSILVIIDLSNNPLSVTEIMVPITLDKLLMEWTNILTLTIRCRSIGNCVLTNLQLRSDMLETPIIDEVKNTIIYFLLKSASIGIPETGLRSDAFTDLPNLGSLHLFSHSFDPYAAFSQLVTVDSISFSSFGLTDESLLFGAEGLAMQPNMFYLGLLSNSLTRIPNVASLPIKTLILKDNNIAVIDRNILAGMTLLETLNLQNNPIENVEEFQYPTLPNIQVINIE